MNVRATLEELGYQLSEDRGHYRAQSLFRNGVNPTSLRIDSETGYFTDFGSGDSGSLKRLIQLTLGLKDYKEVDRWAEGRGGINTQRSKSKPKVYVEKHYPKSSLDRLMPSYTFYNKRNISSDTLRTFHGGVAMTGKMNNRFVFPVYDAADNIVGFAGRDLLTRDLKWKIIGPKRLFVHRFSLARPYIEEAGYVILVESLGDMLALWEAGIRNVLVTFGITLQGGLFKALVGMNPKKILISLNYEPEKESGGGMQGATKISGKLKAVFEPEKIIIRYPTKNDFGMMNVKENLKWIDELKNEGIV